MTSLPNLVLVRCPTPIILVLVGFSPIVLVVLLLPSRVVVVNISGVLTLVVGNLVIQIVTQVLPPALLIKSTGVLVLLVLL